MAYFVMDYKMGAGAAFIMERPKNIDEKLKFHVGIKLDVELPVIEFILDKDSQGKVLDFLDATIPGLVMSGKLKAALEKAGIDNIDYYPAKITDKVSKKVYEDYFVANVIGVIACLDWDSSEYTTRIGMPDVLRSIEDMQLDYSKIHDQKIFRLKEWLGIVVVDESVKKTVEAAKITGVDFLPVEGYEI